MATDDPHPRKRSSSFKWLPPNMCELRVVLLGNSWSQRSSVGNVILGETKFNTEEEPDCCLTEIGQIKDKEIVLINTPDLLHPNISENKLSEHVENCVRLSDPGPHVFLLVLQPEDFTENQKGKLDRILGKFSDRSFDHVLVLITTPREESSGVKKKYMTHPPLKDMIRMCRYRYLKQKNLERPELLTRLGQTAKENNGEHVSCDVFEDAPPALPGDHQSLKQRGTQISIMDAVKAAGLRVVKKITPQLAEKTPVTQSSALRIVLLGKSEDKQTRLGNFIIVEESFHHQRLSPTRQCVATCGEWRGKPLTVVKTPNIFSLSEEAVRREVMNCLTLCPPGPNVLLLLVKPSGFTEEDRETLKFILNLFGQDAFKYSMVIMTHEGRSEMSVTVNELLRDCGGRYYSMSEDNHTSLMERIEETANKHIRAALNLVLCGRRGAGKTSAAKAILGQTELHSVSSSSECVKHQGEVCGRWVSLVELPALYGKPQEAVMEESFRCISLCDPEGVHAFILVLPVRPLTDEDKGELETIRNTFSSRVNDFTLILFTVESDPTAPDVVNFISKNNAIQELCQSCGGRYVVLNIKDQQQIPELLDAVEKMRVGGSRCFTVKMFTKAQMDNVSRLKAELQDLKQKKEMGTDDITIQKEVERILKEKEEEMKKQREELQRKHEEEMEAVKKRMEQQRADTEKERQRRDKQLKEMEENINKEREERKKEQEMREDEDRERKAQEDIQRQDWEQKLDRELEQSKEEMRKQKENWEKQRQEWWDRQYQQNEQRRQEEQTKLKRLQEEYEQEREKDEKKRREEDRIRREQEEKERKELEENYKKKLEEMKRKYEEEARKQAEEFNEFRQKYTKDFTALVEKHMEEIQELKKRHERQMRENEESHDREYNLLQNLSGHKEKSMKEETETLKKKHEQEIYELKQKYQSKCIIL
ncbi:hypothetical protein ABVT39_018500 [Epinephelus coioides]